MKPYRLVTSLVVLLLALGLAQADEKAGAPQKDAVAEIDLGKQAALDGKADVAIDHLQKAIALLQQSLQGSLQSLLPAAPAGWKRGKADTNSGSWGSGADTFQFTTSECSYTNTTAERDVRVELSNSPMLVDGMKQAIAIYKSEQYRKMMAASGMVVEDVSDGKVAAWLTVEQDGSAQVLAVAGRVLCTINGDAADRDTVKALWAAIDHAALSRLGKR